MKLFIFILAVVSTSVFAETNLKQQALINTKMNFEKKAFDLKVSEEQALVKILGKEKVNFLGLIDSNLDMSCVEWVYQGPASRDEAAAACRGVSSMECVEFVYRGSASRVESAEACQYVTDMRCVEFVYKGPASREEAARSCAGSSGPGRPPGCY